MSKFFIPMTGVRPYALVFGKYPVTKAPYLIDIYASHAF